MLDPSKAILATITNDASVNKNNKSILAEGFDIRKPSTLILKSVDDRYNGGYKFRVEEDFKQYESVVTVLVTSKWHFILTTRKLCSKSVVQSNYFAELNGHTRKIAKGAVKPSFLMVKKRQCEIPNIIKISCLYLNLVNSFFRYKIHYFPEGENSFSTSAYSFQHYWNFYSVTPLYFLFKK